MRKLPKYTVLIPICSLAVFAQLVVVFLRQYSPTHQALLLVDSWLAGDWLSRSSPAAVNIMKGFSVLLDPPIFFMLTAAFAVYLIFKKDRLYLSLLLLGGFGGFLLETLFKRLIQRPRPESTLIAEHSFSMPSGHATIAAVFFTVLAMVIYRYTKNRVVRLLGIILCAIIALLIGASRVYLNVHWFSDVLAGYALGLFWISTLVLFLRPARYH